jgi:hypothetical protein
MTLMKQRDRSLVQARNAALLAAESARAQAVHEAQVEYSETVCKFREHFDTEVRAAGETLRRATMPAYKAYNAAVIAAESWAVSSL